MKTIEIILLIVGIFLVVSIVGNILLSTELSEERSKDCITLSEHNKALAEAQNNTMEMEGLYNKSQKDLSKCSSDLEKEKEKKKPINITLDHVWTLILGVSLSTILFALIKLLILLTKQENKKR